MSSGISLVKDVSISGGNIFLEKTTDLINELKNKNIPFEVKNSHSFTDGGTISIELHKSKGGIRSGLFKVIGDHEHHDPVIQRFTVTSGGERSGVLGVTFSMQHPEFHRALRHEFEKLIA
jgi:hypothetical protein